MKLLLVDDEEYVIESIKRNLDLTETGVSEVCTAFSVQQAKNIMEMVDIDIVISDIVMPGGTGFDFVATSIRTSSTITVGQERGAEGPGHIPDKLCGV